MTELPDQLRELEHKLRSVRFRPRASLEPELLGRLRRGELPPHRSGIPLWRSQLVTAAVAVLTVAAALAFAGIIPGSGVGMVSVDRCCYDLDGGGEADDGVIVLAQRDSKVHRLRIYEDLDGSGSYTQRDVVRLDRGERPAIIEAGGRAIVTIKHCCIDFDGGGPNDDGLLVMGVPPNRVLMAAIYETGPKARDRSSAAGWLLR
jgi:hypothetical protein